MRIKEHHVMPTDVCLVAVPSSLLVRGPIGRSDPREVARPIGRVRSRRTTQKDSYL